MDDTKLTFLLWHHDVHGPVALEEIWNGTHGFAGSVSRLRILFWLAERGHEVCVFGNVKSGSFKNIRAISGSNFSRVIPKEKPAILLLNNPPYEQDWEKIPRPWNGSVIIWAGNPIATLWVDRIQSGDLSRIVCVSQYHRELYRIYPEFECVEVVYSGADVDVIESASPNPAAENKLLFASIPRSTKGFDNFLKAWREVRKVLPESQVRVCGSAVLHDPAVELGETGILDRDLEEEFPDFFSNPPHSMLENGIELMGVRDRFDIPEDMKAALAVVVNCNWRGGFETYCLAAVEAQLAGAPVIGASRGALTEVVLQNETGILVEREDVSDLAKAIIKILQDAELRKNMKSKGPAWASRFVSYEYLCDEWEAVANRALRGETVKIKGKFGADCLRKVGYGQLRSWARNMIRGTKLEQKLQGLMGG